MFFQVAFYGSFFYFVEIGNHFFCKAILALKEHSFNVKMLLYFTNSKTVVKYILPFYV